MDTSLSEKGPVRLRSRMLKDGRESLYLDINFKGCRKRENLHLYVIPERTRKDREVNRETMEIASLLKAQRLTEIRNGQLGFSPDLGAGMPFLEFFDWCIEDAHGSRERWKWCRRHLVKYMDGKKPKLKDIDREWVEGFKRYLDTKAVDQSHLQCEGFYRKPLSLGSKGGYLMNLKTCLTIAVRRGFISSNPAAGVRNFKTAEPRRVYLTLDEVKALDATPCKYPALKRAFLFSCLTGLRRSDILKLTWSEVETNADFTRLIYRQKKTGGQEYLDISPQAVKYMGERGEDSDLVFRGLYITTRMGYELRGWVRSAGINKDVTFHTGRHTFAVLMLDLGADIYTVSKLLGHRELKTTQIYADLLDKKKQAAVSLIPDFDA